jgi:phage baseplate assembly protein W
MTEEDQRAFLGKGWAFPVCPDAAGRIDLAAHEEEIAQAIKIILLTDRGERVMRPDFGAGLSSFVFEPVSQTTMHLVKRRVEESLIDWEPRIEVQSVKVTPSGDRNAILIDVTYRVRATNTVRNLVFPFYLEEGASR